jgi:hypothetical protein
MPHIPPQQPLDSHACAGIPQGAAAFSIRVGAVSEIWRAVFAEPQAGHETESRLLAGVRASNPDLQSRQINS